MDVLKVAALLLFVFANGESDNFITGSREADEKAMHQDEKNGILFDGNPVNVTNNTDIALSSLWEDKEYKTKRIEESTYCM